jgi:DNA repair protein RadD
MRHMLGAGQAGGDAGEEKAMTLELRDDQAKAVDDLRAAFKRGRKAPLLVAPTAFGKTVVGAWIIRSAIALGNEVLFCAGRVELIDQTVATLARSGVTDVRVIQADRDIGPASAPVTVASIDTLRAREITTQAKLLILDEAHHGAARTWRAVTEKAPGAMLLGLSATPERGDGRALDLFDEVVLGPSVKQLTELGRLCRCRIWAPTEQQETGRLALDPVTAWRQYAGGRRAVVFCAKIEHATAVVATFVAAGISSALVTGTTPATRRADTLARFRTGAITALVNVGVLTEGWDDPECSVAIVARKVGKPGLWIQMGGRILRTAPQKEEATLIDLAGNVHEHGTLDMDREYSLSGRGIRPAVIKDAIRQCAACGSIALTGPAACIYCGAEYPIRAVLQPRITGAGLVDVTGRPIVKREYLVVRTQTRSEPCASCRNPIRVGDKYRWATVARRATHIRCPLPAVPPRPETA